MKYKNEPMNEFVTRPPEAVCAPLFARCFDLPEEEAREIIATFAPDATALIFETGEGISAECFLIPLMLGGHYGLYVYGVCVSPERRGRGYMRRMLKSASDYAKEIGCDFLLLIPANEELRATYRRMGFTEELPLAADAKGETFYLQVPKAQVVRPFDGDYASLYLKTERTLPFSAFLATLQSVEGELILTENGGFRLQSKEDPARCFITDKDTAKRAMLAEGERALLFPLRPLSALPTLADPLPR